MTEQKSSIEPEEKKVVITPEDAKAAFQFWKEFDVPVMAGLQEAFEAFQANPTLENQERLKYFVTTAVATTDHECFKDETFAKVAEECAAVSYNMQFDQQFEETVTVTEEGSK